MTNNKAREVNNPIIKELIDETTPDELDKIDAEMTNNKQQTALKWFLIECGKYGDTAQIPDEVIEQAKEMEAIGKEMSYDDGYREGYRRALELTQWAISNLIPPHNYKP
jgi:hypothetical protein